MLDTAARSNRPSLMVKPTTIKPAGQPQSQPQIIVIPQSMLASNGIKTVFSIADGQNRLPTVTRIIKPTVPLISRPAESNKTVSLKRPFPQPSPPCSGSDDDIKSELFSDETGAKVRKRANLDHMTLEEKMMRRKLKNRVAAQNARDKKRMKMEDMEVTVRQLQQQNKILAKQNEELLALNRRLMAENSTLKSTQSQTTVLVKEEELEVPLSPESLRPPSSQTPPLSSDEDEEILLSTALPIEAVDTSTVPVNLHGAVAAVAGRRSPVSHRLRVPAAGTKSMSGRGAGHAQRDGISHGAGTVGLSLVDVSSQSVAEIFADDFTAGSGSAGLGTIQLAIQEEEQLVAPTLSASDNLDELLAASFSESRDDTWHVGGLDEANEEKLSHALSEQFDNYLLQFDQVQQQSKFTLDEELESFDNLFPEFGLD